MRYFLAFFAVNLLGCGFLSEGESEDEPADKAGGRDEADADGDSDSDADADADGDSDADADGDSDADADGDSDADCGPWAAVALGRTWEWEYEPSSGVDGTFSAEVTRLSGGEGELTQTGNFRGEGYTQVLSGTAEFFCDDGYYFVGSENQSTTTVDGSSTNYSSTTTYDEPVLVMPADLSDGDTWTSEYDYTTRTGGENYTGYYTQKYTVMGTENIEVEAGTFSAFKLKLVQTTESSNTTHYSYIARDVGTVAGDGYELVDFQP